MTPRDQLEAEARRLLTAGRTCQYVADITGLPRHHVVLLAETQAPPPPRQVRGPDRTRRGPALPDQHGRVPWFVGRVPAPFLDRIRVEAARRGVPIHQLTVQLCQHALTDLEQQETA